MMKAKRPKKSQTKAPRTASTKLPFIEHLLELRKRLFYVALSVGVFSAGAYGIQQHIVNALLRPAHNQQFIYTSVGGGIDFLFRVCVYTGIACSIPVIVYHILRYLEPLIDRSAVKFIAWGSVASGVLAAVGMAFGYFIGLPAALHFLLHQFTTSQIHALLTIQSYMSFVTLYMLGSALLFQLPLLLILINRIKPLKPKKLLGMERWVILVAFVGGGIMNPSPRIQDQILLAGPMIISYQIGVLVVWLANRRSRHQRRVAELLAKDATARAERQARFAAAQAALQQKLAAMPQTRPVLQARPSPTATAAPVKVATPAPAAVHVATPGRPRLERRSYFNDFRARRAPAPAAYRSFAQNPDPAES